MDATRSEKRTSRAISLHAVDRVLPGPQACPNCGTEQQGPFCHACGQRHRDGRLTLRYLARNVVTRFFDLESGLLHTAWRLTVAPGTVSQDVVLGRRKRHMGPIAYLVIVATLSILAFLLVDDLFAQYLAANLAPALEESGGLLGNRDPAAFAQTLSHWINQGTLYFSVFIAIVFAGLGRWAVPGWKQRYNFAESCVFTLYTTAHATLLALPFNSLLFVAVDARYITPMSLLGITIMAVYAAVAARSFVQPHWTTTLMTFLVFTSTYVLFSFLAGAVGVLLALLVL